MTNKLLLEITLKEEIFKIYYSKMTLLENVSPSDFIAENKAKENKTKQ